MATISLTLFTDGSSLGNPGPGGYGIVFYDKENQQVLELGGSENDTTNNRMELKAVIEGLMAVRKIEKNTGDDINVTIHTDSAYLINGITKWVFSWERNNWVAKNNESVQNQDLWQALVELVRDLDAHGGVNFEKVSGHSGVLGNERADRIATSFAENGDAELFSGTIKEYEDFVGGDVLKLEKTKKKSAKSKSGKAYSYVSMVDGNIFVDKTWDECKKRVHGSKGAKYKKAMSEEDEKELIALWSLESLGIK